MLKFQTGLNCDEPQWGVNIWNCLGCIKNCPRKHKSKLALIKPSSEPRSLSSTPLTWRVFTPCQAGSQPLEALLQLRIGFTISLSFTSYMFPSLSLSLIAQTKPGHCAHVSTMAPRCDIMWGLLPVSIFWLYKNGSLEESDTCSRLNGVNFKWNT